MIYFNWLLSLPIPVAILCTVTILHVSSMWVLLFFKLKL